MDESRSHADADIHADRSGCGVCSDHVDIPPVSSPSPDEPSSPENPDTTPISNTLELVVTVIKNEKLEVSGDAFGGLTDSGNGALSLSLLDSPVGSYGFLDILNEIFQYVLRNDLPQVQALGFSEVVQDILLTKLPTPAVRKPMQN